MTDDAETQDIADARQSKDIALTLTLQLAGRLLAHVDEHDALSHGVFHEKTELAGGLVEWHLTAKYGDGNQFIVVEGSPVWKGPSTVSQEEYARIMQNTAQEFACNVPRVWVEAALRDAERV